MSGGQSAMRAPRVHRAFPVGDVWVGVPLHLLALARSEKKRARCYVPLVPPVLSCTGVVAGGNSRARAGCLTRVLLQVARSGNASTSVGSYLFGSGASVCHRLKHSLARRRRTTSGEGCRKHRGFLRDLAAARRTVKLTSLLGPRSSLICMVAFPR